jgi:hypothetical protein
MKKTKTIAWILLTVGALQFLTSCFGKFALTKKVYAFHDGIMGNDFLGRFVKSVLLIFPMDVVYTFSILIDSIILNLIEFWTGANPMALAPGQSDTQYITLYGKKYKVTAEHLKMTFVDLSNNKLTVLHFDANTSAVSVLKDGQMVKVGDYKIESRNFASMKQFNGAM